MQNFWVEGVTVPTLEKELLRHDIAALQAQCRRTLPRGGRKHLFPNLEALPEAARASTLAALRGSGTLSYTLNLTPYPALSYTLNPTPYLTHKP